MNIGISIMTIKQSFSLLFFYFIMKGVLFGSLLLFDLNSLGIVLESAINIFFNISVEYLILILIIKKVRKINPDFKLSNLSINSVNYKLFLTAFIFLVGFFLLYYFTIGLWINEMAKEPFQEYFVKLETEFKRNPYPIYGSAFIIAPVFEELFFRGVILNELAKRFQFFKAIIFSSLFFAASHLSISSFIPTVMFGLIIGFLYLNGKSLISCILLHALMNIFMTVIDL